MYKIAFSLIDVETILKMDINVSSIISAVEVC